MKRGSREYLGDGVYVELDGEMLKLTTDDGLSVTNTIYLEDFVYRALVDYVGRLAPPPEDVGVLP